MKKIILSLLVFILLITMTGCSSKKEKTYGSITDQAIAESKAVKDSETKEFTDINVDKFIEYYKGEDNKIVLLSRPTCAYCQIAEPILKNISYKYNIEINHINTDEMTEEDFTKLSNVNKEFESFGTPFLVIVSNNKIIDKVSGLTITSSYEKFFKQYKFINK